MPVPKQLDVFISSTCFDLIDLRAELGRYLKERGFYVRLSDDPTSDFSVEASTDSIESCLANVAASDAVVCVIDRRYGGSLKDGKYKGKSATHAEIDLARELAKPIFFFIRDRAANEFAFMRDNGTTLRTRWVEEVDQGKRDKWLDFVMGVSKLPRHAKWSNWYDSFTDVVDLKELVHKRLGDSFPQQAIGFALAPDRMVRMTFVLGKGAVQNSIYGHFLNVGVGPGLNVIHGIAEASLLPSINRQPCGPW